ncbi:MAG: lysophospholipid acyltransferase family protein [Sulfurospirillum sp.]|nr:lysophospholipid acyltransferase family protein [Sulfurospirillum sp.]
MKEKLEYIIVKSLLWIFSFLPKKTLYATTWFIAMLFFRFGTKRRKLTLANLKLAFDDKSTKEIYELAKKCYENIGITVAEIILMLQNRIDLDTLINNKTQALNQLQELTKDAKHGAIFVTAHFSNWELGALFLAKNGYPMTAIGRAGNNTYIEKTLTTPFRQKFGSTNVHKDNAILKIVKTLKTGGYAGLLIDQKAGGGMSMQARFFGMAADTTTSVAMLKLKYNPRIIPLFLTRENDGTYTIRITTCKRGADATLESLTQEYNDILEAVIRTYPEQWFWMHNRWRIA